MNLLWRSFGGLFLLFLSCLMLFQGGCGGSKSNQPMDITAGTWTFKSGSSIQFTATFTTIPCSNTNVPLGTSVWSVPSLPSSGDVCLSTSNVSSSGPDITAQGMVLAVTANPVPANGTASIAPGYGFFAGQITGGDAYYDLSGTFSAGSMSMSGNYSCDPSCSACDGDSGSFSGTLN